MMIILASNHDILERKEEGVLPIIPVNLWLHITGNFGIERDHTSKSKDKRQHPGRRRSTMYSGVLGLHVLKASPGSLWS